MLDGENEQLVSAECLRELLCLSRGGQPSEIIVVIICCDECYGAAENREKTKWSEMVDDNETILWEDKKSLVFFEKIETKLDRQQYRSRIMNLFGNSRIRREKETEYSIGVSEKGLFKEMKKLYIQAKKALKHRMYLGAGQCLFYEELPGNLEIVHPFLYFEKNAIKESVNIIRMDQVKVLISRQFEYLRQKKCTENSTVEELCIAIKNAIFEALKEKDVDIEGILNTNQQLFQNQMRFTDLKSYEAWLTDYCMLLMQGLKDLNGRKYSATIFSAVDFISRHYMEDISLTRVADEVRKSPSYFSSIFKKEMGVNYNEYLNQIRIRKAKEMLKTSDAVIYEVAEKTGFHDYKYFTKVFKRICGCSPSEYMRNG